MKHRILMLMAGLTISGAAIAQYGQPGRGPGGYNGVPGGGPGWNGGEFWRGAPDSPRQRIQFLQDRINRGMGDGSLDRREARSALAELNNIRRMDARMHYDNAGRLSPNERGIIQGRLDQLSQRLHWMRHNGY